MERAGWAGVAHPDREAFGARKGTVVAISLSVVVLLLIVLIVLVRNGSIKAGPAIVAILFGFFLASTGMAPSINRFLTSLADTINQIKL